MYYRVVIRRIDHRGKRVVEFGPWLSRYEAEEWAELLRALGYHVDVEGMQGRVIGGVPRGDEDDG